MSLQRKFCKFLLFLHLHNPACERCLDRAQCWDEDVRQRLKDLLAQEPSPKKSSRNDAA